MYMFSKSAEIEKNIIKYSNVFDILDDIEVRCIRNNEDMDDLYRLRYKAYKSKNYIAEREDHMCFDNLDNLENSYNFGIYKNNRMVSSIRIHLLSDKNRNSPSMFVYDDALSTKIDDGCSFVDSSRFTIDPEYGSENKFLCFVTMRLSVMACIFFDVDYSLSLVRPSHRAFYMRYFGFKTLAEGRRYPSLNFPVNLYACDTMQAKDRVMQRLPFLNSLPCERRQLFDQQSSQKCCFTVQTTASLAANEILKKASVSIAGEKLAFA